MSRRDWRRVVGTLKAHRAKLATPQPTADTLDFSILTDAERESCFRIYDELKTGRASSLSEDDLALFDALSTRLLAHVGIILPPCPFLERT